MTRLTAPFRVLFSILVATNPAFCADPVHETEWVRRIRDAEVPAGELEHRLPDGRRVDLLTETTAWEFDFAHKWTEGVGQALGYGIATNRRPGLWLLKKRDEDEEYNQALGVVTLLRERGIPIEFRVTEIP